MVFITINDVAAVILYSLYEMNRAFDIRYGLIDNSAREINVGDSSDQEWFVGYQNPGTTRRRTRYSFGSHLILSSCLIRRDSEIIKSLWRDIPGTAVAVILDFLDRRTMDIVKLLLRKTPTSILTTRRDSRNSKDTLLKGFGSKAHLAMTVLANRLRPLIIELRSINSTKKNDREINCKNTSPQDTTKLISTSNPIGISYTETVESGISMTPFSMSSPEVRADLIDVSESSVPRDIVRRPYIYILMVGVALVAECLWLLRSFLLLTYSE